MTDSPRTNVPGVPSASSSPICLPGSSHSYRNEIIHERKTRTISKLPIADHVIQWAACLHVEPLLCGTFIRRSCSCVKGRGTHDFVDLLRNDMQDYKGTYYYVQLDAHHFFQHIRHDLMKQRVRVKIKDPKLLRFLDEFIDSYYQGLPLGVKISLSVMTGTRWHTGVTAT